MICQMIGIFLYCGQATQPLAMIPQSNNLPTADLAQQLYDIQQARSSAASTTTLQQLIDCGVKNDGRSCTRK